MERPNDFEWREAVIDLARAQRAYAEITATPDAPDILVNRVWLWLWRAERRRDELLNTSSGRGSYRSGVSLGTLNASVIEVVIAQP